MGHKAQQLHSFLDRETLNMKPGLDLYRWADTLRAVLFSIGAAAMQGKAAY